MSAEELLSRAGLPASPEEIASVERMDQTQRMLVEALYAVPEARYADMALTFRAEVTGAPWEI